MPLARKLLIAWIVVFTGLTAFAIHQNRELGKQGKDARDALCVLKEDLRARVEASRQYLKDHPRGAPGIPASLIKSSIANQQSTLAALSVVDCNLEPLRGGGRP